MWRIGPRISRTSDRPGYSELTGKWTGTLRSDGRCSKAPSHAHLYSAFIGGCEHPRGVRPLSVGPSAIGEDGRPSGRLPPSRKQRSGSHDDAPWGPEGGPRGTRRCVSGSWEVPSWGRAAARFRARTLSESAALLSTAGSRVFSAHITTVDELASTRSEPAICVRCSTERARREAGKHSWLLQHFRPRPLPAPRRPASPLPHRVERRLWQGAQRLGSCPVRAPCRPALRRQCGRPRSHRPDSPHNPIGSDDHHDRGRSGGFSPASVVWPPRPRHAETVRRGRGVQIVLSV
jgi:hypothetical protein